MTLRYNDGLFRSALDRLGKIESVAGENVLNGESVEDVLNGESVEDVYAKIGFDPVEFLNNYTTGTVTYKIPVKTPGGIAYMEVNKELELAEYTEDILNQLNPTIPKKEFWLKKQQVHQRKC